MKIDHVEGAILIAGRGAGARGGVEDSPALAHVAAVLESCLTVVRLVTRAGARPSLDLPCVVDERPEQAPMIGVHAALRACTRSAVLIAADDLSTLDPKIVLALLALVPAEGEFDIVAPQGERGFEPLLAVYRPRLLPELEARIAEGAFGLQELLAGVRTLGVPVGALREIVPELSVDELCG